MSRLARPPLRLMLSVDAVGGVWRYTLELARGIAARGGETVLAVMGPPPDPAQRREAAAIAGLSLLETGWPLDWTAPDPAALEAAVAGLRRLARERAVAAVHVHAPALVGNAAWPVPVVAVAHSCLATWWAAVRGGTPPADFQWRIVATAQGLAAADAVIVPTAAFAQALRTAYALRRELRVVHNGRDPLPIPARPVPQSPGVLTVGRLWDAGKDVALLDAAAAEFALPVRAAGPLVGPNGAALRLTHILPLGPLGEHALAAAYAESTVFAAPALYEPFGLSVLEAAQAGCALVLADIPGFRELWDGAANFVERRDPRAWREALTRAAAAEADWGARAARRAERYTAAAMVERTLAVHEALCAETAA